MSEPSAVARLVDSSTSHLLPRLGDTVRTLIGDVLDTWGLTGRELRALSSAHGRTLSQRELGSLTGLDRTTMVAVVDKLERLGYARRERDPTDRRKYLITLTGDGTRVADEAIARLAKAQAEFLSPLNAAEQHQLNTLLLRLYEAHDPTCERP
ncbi:MarR family winged helix-turn-helix transcriptional regulator [Spirillospora sp. CA-294931]|uniref:MarR family winged helix-turn-helix transcriptional regulator n=1 Tax=Spirillospora sp. CA-294931 TaxID=3240042 RepID=UPI003D908E73